MAQVDPVPAWRSHAFAAGSAEEAEAVVHVVLATEPTDETATTVADYDRRICAGLRASGWVVFVHVVPGSWPRRDADGRRRLARLLDGIPDEALVVIADVIAGVAADVLEPVSERLHLVTLVHEPVGPTAVEAAVLGMSRAVITSSRWSARWLSAHYGIDRRKTFAVPAGAEAMRLSPGTRDGGRLLCVGALDAAHAQDVLVDALGEVADLDWCCRFVSSEQDDPRLVGELRARAVRAGVADRIAWTGSLAPAELARVHGLADAVVVPSRIEPHAAGAAAALVRGLPVIGTQAGALPEVMGDGADRPGLLVPPQDPTALAGALRRWLTDADGRERMRHAAVTRGAELPRWEHTIATVEGVLRSVASARVRTARAAS